jgi:hypothetical protein
LRLIETLFRDPSDVICVVLDYNTVIFQKEKVGGGTHICKTPIVKVDRNKNVTLNTCP